MTFVCLLIFSVCFYAMLYVILWKLSYKRVSIAILVIGHNFMVWSYHDRIMISTTGYLYVIFLSDSRVIVGVVFNAFFIDFPCFVLNIVAMITLCGCFTCMRSFHQSPKTEYSSFFLWPSNNDNCGHFPRVKHKRKPEQCQCYPIRWKCVTHWQCTFM